MSRKGQFSVMIILLIAVSLLTSCDTRMKPVEERTTMNNDAIETIDLSKHPVMRFNWSAEPPDLDPQTSTDNISFLVINATMEGLFRLNIDGSVGEGLAESYEVSEDETTYTFHLRDALWSDGTPITAEDFEYAWKRALNPEISSQYAYQLYYIEGAKEYNTRQEKDASKVAIKALDDKTLQVKLVRPTPFFLRLTTFITYIPAQKKAIQAYGADYANEAGKIIYSGPFVIEEWIHDEKLSLTKNVDYWDADSVKLDRIIGYMINDNSTLINMYESNELDHIVVPAEFLDKFINSSEYRSLAEATTWYLMFNTEGKYFSNPKMRLAFALATDAETYVNVLRQRQGLVAEGLTPPTLAGKGHSFAQDRHSELPGYDPVKAARLFQEAMDELGATKEEFENEVTIVAGEGDTWSRISQFFQEQWKESFGVELFIEQISFSERLERYRSGEYEIAHAGWGGDYNDPLTFLDVWVSEGGNNTAYWSSERYDDAINIAIQGKGFERIDALAEAEAILAEELPIYPLYHPNKSIAVKNYVKDLGIYPLGAGYDFKWVYIEN
ncbi:MAG: peptide ABC transporter substrate-binding protein [Tissierellales bacterium]|nr:peptide ABC transporter substrate-binding protein [Tissierellales bacterium]MBN2826963.1 peptide ABC transporter substrate-binding protein [Tissierellales bacterium]